MNVSRFIENAVHKQEEAYKKGYAIQQFSYSCQRCITGNYRYDGACSDCPIKKAHVEALTRIELESQNWKDKSKKSFHRNKDGSITVTITIHYD